MTFSIEVVQPRLDAMPGITIDTRSCLGRACPAAGAVVTVPRPWGLCTPSVKCQRADGRVAKIARYHPCPGRLSMSAGAGDLVDGGRVFQPREVAEVRHAEVLR